MSIEFSESLEQYEWSESATNLIILHEKGELTQKMVDVWLNTISEKDHDIAIMDLESGLCEQVKDLPE
jgi:hypothetical protein